MRRKLLVLNVALLALLAYAGWQLRRAWLAAKAREAAELNRRIKPAAPPPFTPLPHPEQVTPAGYADIAQQMLFDKSRNPTVVVEVPKAEPPPPKPMPPLPVYHGQMDIGDGPVVILSEGANGPHQAIHPGEQIGQFKLLDVNTEEIAFEWDGKTVRRKVETLIDRGVVQQAASTGAVRTEQPVAAAPVAKTPLGPGGDTGRGFKTCEPNDSMPVGTVVDGYRKVSIPTPFGEACRWDPVGR